MWFKNLAVHHSRACPHTLEGRQGGKAQILTAKIPPDIFVMNIIWRILNIEDIEHK
jgi:hypothetical protein